MEHPPTAHQPGCPWQSGRGERFIGNGKQELMQEPVEDGNELITVLKKICTGYNHEHPDDQLRRRTPAEV